jgi:hypothetical protein
VPSTGGSIARVRKLGRMRQPDLVRATHTSLGLLPKEVAERRRATVGVVAQQPLAISVKADELAGQTQVLGGEHASQTRQSISTLIIFAGRAGELGAPLPSPPAVTAPTRDPVALSCSSAPACRARPSLGLRRPDEEDLPRRISGGQLSAQPATFVRSAPEGDAE